ncbi:MAG: glycerophosphodiester phosphodiesterase family protein, partial [Fimbriimonadaceae bacterium]|nr:glycerophosphodiester phosphodiesterase family protein [Fimbriimonadaceae bacterium]
MSALALLSLSLLATGPNAGWKSDPVQIILHRGASMAAPENSAGALNEAVRQGADGIEIDLRRTRDGHWVLYHDDWLPDTLGPIVRFEDLTLAEVRQLSLDSRWGLGASRATPVVMARDALEFARDNGLLLFLDLKTLGYDTEVMALITATGTQSLIVAPDRMRTRPALAMYSEWGYLKGGEEDSARMKELATAIREQSLMVMADDARLLADALGRRPSARKLRPFRARPFPRSQTIAADWNGITEPGLRRALWRQAAAPDASRWSKVREIALTHPSARVRMDAAFALGSDASPESTRALAEIASIPDAVNPARHASGIAYFDTYRLATVAAALARQATPAAHA